MAPLAAGSVYAISLGEGEGNWPKSWPKELEPLRKQSSTWSDVVPAGAVHYRIPFTERERFEAAWPHLLKVKTPGAPIFLLPGPRETTVGDGDGNKTVELFRGVEIFAPDKKRDAPPGYGQPRPDEKDTWLRWGDAYRIVLLVDGDVVDLNRIPLPADTPIIDRRFESDGKK